MGTVTIRVSIMVTITDYRLQFRVTVRVTLTVRKL